MEEEAEIDRLPTDLLAHILVMITSFTDLAQASGVCRKWKQGVKQALARRHTLSFAGCKMDDDSTARLVLHAYSLKELDISRSRWGCQITDNGLYQISSAKCISNLTSISLWGMTGITDKGVVQLITGANSLQHLNVGGTFITDESLYAIANSCPRLKVSCMLISLFPQKFYFFRNQPLRRWIWVHDCLISEHCPMELPSCHRKWAVCSCK
ncbi:hypothetical protein PTKIN_Ptkin08bG0110400 [Pterospermum kingtungense]